MVKKNKELDEQYKYFTRKISNTIADIGTGIGLLLSVFCFFIVMIGYYLVPAKDDEDSLGFKILEDVLWALYSLILFIVRGLYNYLTNLPEWVLWCFIGIIVGIAIFIVFIAVFWEELEEEETKEEKRSDSEIWNDIDPKKKDRSDGTRIYQFSAKLISHKPLSKETLDELTEGIDYLFGDGGFSVDSNYEEVTNEVPE